MLTGILYYPPLQPLSEDELCEEISVLRIYPGKFSTLGRVSLSLSKGWSFKPLVPGMDLTRTGPSYPRLKQPVTADSL